MTFGVESKVVLGNKQQEIRESSISHCKKQKNTINCLVESGENYKTALSFSNSPYFNKYHELCKENTISLQEHWYHYISCLSSASNVIEGHPLPDLYAVNLDRARYRSEWTAACVKQEGKNISHCLQKKELHLSEFISIYMSLTKNESTLVERCASENLIKAGEFEFINNCIKRSY